MACFRNRRRSRSILILLAWGALARPALAWDYHQGFMASTVNGLPPEFRKALDSKFSAPCPIEDQLAYGQLASQLGLQPQAPIPPTAPALCDRHGLLSPAELLTGPLAVADEPDNGMDQDLDDSADPAGDRKFMGGTRGVTSRGFRHMYFGGWKVGHPIATFQIPVHPLGQAPERVEKMAAAARELMRAGHPLWAFRVLGWATHYVQDLAQPFHAAQIPNTAMVPWYELLTWPPGEAFSRLVSETTRSISNYHFAFEAYVLYRIRQNGDGPFADCLANPEAHLKDYGIPANPTPRQIADIVAERSVGLATEVGHGAIELFGTRLQNSQIDLPNHKGEIDYADLTIRPDLMNGRRRLEAVTCVALANAVWGSRQLIEWLVKP